MSNLRSVCLYARPPNMTNFWVKNSSRTSVWLNVSLCTNYVTSIFFIESKYFVFADWRMPSPIKYAVWIQFPVVIPTYIRSLKLVHCYLLQKAWQNIKVMTYKRTHRIKKNISSTFTPRDIKHSHLWLHIFGAGRKWSTPVTHRGAVQTRQVVCLIIWYLGLTDNFCF